MLTNFIFDTNALNTNDIVTANIEIFRYCHNRRNKTIMLA